MSETPQGASDATTSGCAGQTAAGDRLPRIFPTLCWHSGAAAHAADLRSHAKARGTRIRVGSGSAQGSDSLWPMTHRPASFKRSAADSGQVRTGTEGAAKFALSNQELEEPPMSLKQQSPPLWTGRTRRSILKGGLIAGAGLLVSPWISRASKAASPRWKSMWTRCPCPAWRAPIERR